MEAIATRLSVRLGHANVYRSRSSTVCIRRPAMVPATPSFVTRQSSVQRSYEGTSKTTGQVGQIEENIYAKAGSMNLKRLGDDNTYKSTGRPDLPDIELCNHNNVNINNKNSSDINIFATVPALDHSVAEESFKKSVRRLNNIGDNEALTSTSTSPSTASAASSGSCPMSQLGLIARKSQEVIKSALFGDSLITQGLSIATRGIGEISRGSNRLNGRDDCPVGRGVRDSEGNGEGLAVIGSEWGRIKSNDVMAVKAFETMPGPRGLPGVGNAIKYSKLGPYRFDKILDNRLHYARQYGNIYRERLGTMDMVHLFDPSDIATMFRLEGKYPSRGLIANLELTYLQRNKKLVGFAFLDGLEWERQRACIQRLMMEPLSAAEYLRWQWPVAKDFVDYLAAQRDSDSVVHDLQANVFKYTMESIGAVCFGDRIGAFKDTAAAAAAGSMDAAAADDVEKLPGYISETLFCLRSCMFNFPWFRYLRTPMYRRFERASNNMRKIMSRYIKAVEERCTAQPRQLALSSSLVEQAIGKDLGACPFRVGSSDQEERDSVIESPVDPTTETKTATDAGSSELCILKMLMEDPNVEPELAVNLVMALFRTGIDSTGNALLFFLHNLASNTDKQEILLEELDRVLPVDGNERPTAEKLHQLPYLKASLRESFRLHYPVFGGSGRVMPEDTIFSGYKVPKGAFIFANMAAMSRMEEYFPRPLEFHPERWLRDERAKLTTTWDVDRAFISLPFSHGLRACPGKRFAEQGIYMAAIAILQKYRLECDDHELEMIHMPFTMPARPLNIRFIPRE